MQLAFGLDEVDSRKLGFLYRQSMIEKRHSVIEDFGLPQDDWKFISKNGSPGPLLDERLSLFDDYALPLSIDAIHDCIDGHISPNEITHLITVSCTGMSAPGLDLQIAEALQMPANIFRTSVNFMGCYAAIHALKLASMICQGSQKANVLIVCTELCTLHFQKQYSIDNAASSLLFADGSAAIFLTNNEDSKLTYHLADFYSEVAYKGKADMSWKLSQQGFLMTLSSYVPQLIEEDIAGLIERALDKTGLKVQEITHWCIHPGGKKILDVIQKQLHLTDDDLRYSREVLANYGNMSSATILFVLQKMIRETDGPANIFGVAFGPGLTMETFIATRS